MLVFGGDVLVRVELVVVGDGCIRRLSNGKV